MLKGRRVGTLTAGIVLIVFGLLFLLRILLPVIDYKLILSLWPLILIFLGIEILVSYIVNKDNVMKYDGGAIIIILLVSFFSMCMACAEFFITHWVSFHLT